MTQIVKKLDQKIRKEGGKSGGEVKPETGGGSKGGGLTLIFEPMALSLKGGCCSRGGWEEGEKCNVKNLY